MSPACDLFTLRNGERTVFGPGRRTGKDAFTLEANRIKPDAPPGGGDGVERWPAIVAEPYHDGVDDNNVWIFSGENYQVFDKLAAVPAPRAVAATQEAYFVSAGLGHFGIGFEIEEALFSACAIKTADVHPWR